ncbi:MAG TPA: hypothetical protein EYP23_05020, partial [Thermoplasmata archaeon]|nr:hypothetical protein [Thermoplasmata archaeon]
MKLKLFADLTFGKNITGAMDSIQGLIRDFNNRLDERKEQAAVEEWNINNDTLSITIVSQGRRRAHELLLQLRKNISEKLGEEYHVGVRSLKTRRYEIVFDVEKKPLHEVSIP